MSGSTAVRHAEKRRTSTCRFADRVAQISVDHYHRIIPESFRQDQKQTCVATIVAHVGTKLQVLAMGVGTKFLPKSVLAAETSGNGERVRDCHAEVLARRAFRRFISLEILKDLDQKKATTSANSFPILERQKLEVETESGESGQKTCIYYRLRAGVTLHFYSSSAPCGNAVLKRFATMSKQPFRYELGPDEWPLDEMHPSIPGYNVSQGEFALLVKKDSETLNENGDLVNTWLDELPKKQRAWTANTRTDWCPPGTSTVWSGQGTIHTCSDKLCRWNCLGLQGSLLSSLFLNPRSVDEWRLLPATLTVGRKLSAITCRRAVCCRVGQQCYDCEEETTRKERQTNSNDSEMANKKRKRSKQWRYDNDTRPNHPVILGTAVYLDKDGVINAPSSSAVERQDVRFHSSLSWAWWVDSDCINEVESLECIDGSTGWALPQVDAKTECRNDSSTKRSKICTAELLDLFLEIGKRQKSSLIASLKSPQNLVELRQFKRKASSLYETKKDCLLSRHPVLRQWRRRERDIGSMNTQQNPEVRSVSREEIT